MCLVGVLRMSAGCAAGLGCGILFCCGDSAAHGGTPALCPMQCTCREKGSVSQCILSDFPHAGTPFSGDMADVNGHAA